METGGEDDRPYEISMVEVLEAVGTHRKHYSIMLVSAIGYAHFSVQTLVATLAAKSLLDEWPWLKNDPMTFNLLFALAAIFRLIGSVVLLPAIDMMGRRSFLCWSFLTSMALGVASAFAPNFAFLVAVRACVSLCASGLPFATTIYSLEMLTPQRRALAAILCQTVSCILLVASTFIHSVWDTFIAYQQAWRWTFVSTNLPTIVGFVLFACLWLETPRHQAVNGDVKGAWLTLASLTPKRIPGLLQRLKLPADHPFPPTNEFQGIYNSIEADTPPSYYEKLVSMVLGMWKLLLAPKFRRLNISLTLAWALQSFAHWGMSTYLTTFYDFIGVNVTWTTAGSYAVQLPGRFRPLLLPRTASGQVLIYYLMQARWAGRLMSMKIHSVASGICLAGLALCLSASESLPWLGDTGWLVALSLGCYFFGATIWAALYAFTAEAYPTESRGAAMSAFGATTALSVVVSTYIGAIALDPDRPWVFPIVWSSLRFFTCAVLFFVPFETRSMDLLDKVSPSTGQS